jgi:hypothetical protein
MPPQPNASSMVELKKVQIVVVCRHIEEDYSHSQNVTM